MLRRFVGMTPHPFRVRWIRKNVMEYAITVFPNSGDHWNAQRDHTQNLSEFEQTGFKKASLLFSHKSNLFDTMDDGPSGTRTADNQVQIVSNRKEHKVGYAADAVADAHSRIDLCLRFRRRDDAQLESIRRLLTNLFHNRAWKARISCVMTADYGYGKRSVLHLISFLRLTYIFLMLDNVIYLHLFIAAFYLNSSREEEERELEEIVRQWLFGISVNNSTIRLFGIRLRQCPTWITYGIP